MPRVKKAGTVAPAPVPAALPLDGCVVAFRGSFPKQNQAALLEHAARLGARVPKSITKDATHLITTQSAFDEPSSKVYDAKNLASKKRQASPTILDSSPEPTPQPKRTKLATTAENGKADVLGKEQIAKSHNIQVPLDEGCWLNGYVVIDEDSVIWDASLNQTNAGKNNNKFYRIQLLVDVTDKNNFKTWTRWGRVGESGQSAILGDGTLQDAQAQFLKKFKDKTGLAWDRRTEDPRPKKLFAAAMTEMNYDAKKLPLGKLSKATIMRGYRALKELSDLLVNPAGIGSTEDLSNLYYSLIPHDFGRNRPAIISNQVALKREIDLLETLADMKDATDLMKGEVEERVTLHPLDQQYLGLGMGEMTPLDPKGMEFQQLGEYLLNTRGQTHHVNYSIESIFRIERRGEKERFVASTSSDRRLLWHGSRVTNFGGILSQGLRIAPPEAPVSGYMFGKGVYLADMSSKSAGYCASYISDGTALLLLCEAELGEPMQELLGADSHAGNKAKSKGLLSTWGKGRTGPSVWKDASCVHPSLAGVKMPDTCRGPPGPTAVNGACLEYNEYICYDVAQVRLRYLFRVKM
ncbi:hypothetical protein VPNG_05860 [Cytospora leucostoma]|uniref:Poly [ADP-ribose] polymerase n=1 Tax=Cytospora leucostoma TaxID=1230097 RepID=A0A423X0F9_9PEZI|nr:hypothetical protein VPNG_05860 [Cytospora leucostoma]